MGIFHRSHHSVALPLSAACLTFVLVFAPLYAAPTLQDKCSIFCRAGQTSVLNYEAGEYSYDFESVISTEVTLPSPESRQTKVKAKVAIAANSACDFVLKVKALSVSDATGNALAPIPDLQETTARFTLQDGIIGSVCVAKDELTYTANIKRAVISLLQNKALNGVSENEVVETDLSGKCPTKYVLSGDNYVKTKKLNACSHREGGFSILHGVPYEVHTNENSLPDLESLQTCEQTLENGIYKTIKCTEVHSIEKPSTESQIIRTTITTTLTFSAKKALKKAVSPRNLVKSSIFFDFSDNACAKRKEVSAQSARDLVEKICDNIRSDGVTSDVPVLHLDLKKVLAHVTKEPLTQLYNDIKSGSLCAAQTEKAKKLLLDAAAMSASDGAIGLLSELYQQGELDKVTKRYFYLYTTFASRPHEEALQAVLPILSGSGQSLSKRSILAISGLAHQFCKITHPDCLEFPEYVSIVDRIAQIVQDNLRDDAQSDVVVVALQALGNLDHLTERAVVAVTAALNSSNDRIRVRALDAFRRDPCQQSLKVKTQEIFANKKNPSNIRISAYLANLRCLQPEDAKVIQRVLNDEDSFQVGGFIQSNLYNLAKSSSPSTRQLKSAAKQLQVQLKYPKELRRFSRHLGSSLFNADLNLGYSAEGNVIFSKESFIPRQVSANLTFDIFGQSYNFLEVGVYLENLDHLQESLFGPHGKFPADKEYNSKTVYNTIMKRMGRSKREVPGPVTLNREGLQALSQQVKIVDHRSEPARADVYVRIYGTTLGVISINPTRAQEAVSELKSKIQALIQGSVRTSKKDVNVMNPILLVDDDVIVPTVSGFGLSTTIEANTIPSLEYSKDLQVPQGDAQPFDLKLKIGTNVAASIKLRHSILGGPIENGLQFEASIRSGGALDIALHYDSQRVEAKFNLPNEKVRAFDISTNVYWIERAPGKSEVKSDFKPSNAVERGPESCQSPINMLLQAVGLKVCVVSNVEHTEGVPAIFNGKQHFSASLEKTEASMQGYSVLFTKEKNGNTRNYQLSLDTPGSTTNRKVSVSALGEDDEYGKRKVEIQVHTPIKGGSAKFEYERTYSEAVKGIQAKLTLPTAVLGVHGEVKRTVSGNEVTYKPLLRLELPGRKAGSTKTTTLLTGKLIHTQGKSLAFDLSSQIPEKAMSYSPMDIFLRGTVLANRNGDTEYEYELKGIQIGARDRDREGEPSPILTLDGHYKLHGSQQETDLKVKYGLELEHDLTYHKSFLYEPGHMKLDAKVASTRVFFLNWDVEAEVTRDSALGKYDSSYKFSYGPNTQPRWSLSSQSNVLLQSKSHFDVQNKLKFYFPIRNDPEETYDVSLLTHVKNFVGEEQLVDVQFLRGDQGMNGKVTLNFVRKASDNNDFQLQVLVNTQKVKGELVQIRETVKDDQAKVFTSSYKYETTLASQTLGIDKEHFVAFVRLLNKPNKKGISVSAKNTVVTSRANIPELNLDVSLKYTPDKYNGHIDFKSEANQLALLDVNVLRKASTTEPQVLLKSFLINQWRIDLTRRTPAENQCVTKLHAEILSTGRTITVDVNRRKEGDVRKLDADLKWDAARDPTKSIQVHSVTSITEGSIIIDSKNEITVVGQKVEANLAATIPTDIKHGEHSVTVTFVGTDGNSHKVEYKNNLGIEPTLRRSQAQIVLTTPELPPTEVHWDVQSANPDLSQLILDISANVEVFKSGVKTLSVASHLDSKKENGRRSIGTKLEVGGESIPDAVHVESNLIIGEKYLSTKGALKVGVASGVEFDGEFQDSSDGYRQADVHFVLNKFPGLTYQKVEGRLAHRHKLGGIDITRENELKLDDKIALKYKYALSLIEGQLKAVAQVIARENQVLDANVQGTVNAQEIDVNGKVAVNDVNVKMNTHVNRLNPLKLFTLGIESGAFGINVKLENTKPSTYALHNALKVNGKDILLDGEVTVAENEKAIGVKYSRNAGEVAGEAKLRVTTSGEDRSFEGLASLGAKKVNFSGNVNKIAGGYEGQSNVQGDSFNSVGKFVVAIEDSKRKLSFIAGDASSPTELLTLEYTKQMTGETTTLEGTFSTELAAHVVTLDEAHHITKGTFKTEYIHLVEATNGENGHELKLSTNFNLMNPVDLTTDLKVTNLELLAQGTVKMPDANVDCTGVIQLKRPAESQPTKHYVFQTVLRNEHAKEVYGIVSKTTKETSPYSLEHTTRLVVGNEQTDALGVHAFAKSLTQDKCEAGIDVQLPQRQISVAYVKNSATSGELSVWLDKARNPEQKLQVIVEFQPLTTEDGATGYKYQATLKHPALSKDIVIKRQVVRFGSLIVHESTTELDILEDTNNKFVITAKVAWAEAAHKHLTAQVSAKSEGLGLLLEGEGDITKQEDSIVANFHYSFNRPNGQLKSRNIEVVVAAGHQSLLIGDKSNPVLLLSRSVRNLGGHRRRRSVPDSNALDVRYEVHLPGMTDTRVLDIHLHSSTPPHLGIKTFTTVPSRTYEISLGFPTERQLLLAAYRQVGAERTSLAEFSMALNTTQLLSVKAKWDLESLKEVLKTASERFENTGNNLEGVTDAYVDEISQEVQEQLQRLAAALPNLAPLQQHISAEIQEMKTEWSQDRPSQAISQLLNVLAHAFEVAIEPVQRALKMLAKLPEYVKELKEKSPELIKRYEKTIKSMKRAVGGAMASVLKTIRPILLQIKNLVDKLDLQTRLNEAKAWRVKARTLLDDVLAKFVEAFIARADIMDQYLQSSTLLSPELKDLGTTVLKHAVRKLKGENAEISEVSEKLRETVKSIVGEVLTVDVQNGVISALIPLPKPVNSLLDVGKAVASAFPRMKVKIPYRNHLTRFVDIVKQFFRDLVRTNFLTAFTRALRTNAPPNTAQAYIIGSQYFITFDGKLFHHEGQCQYLLMQDFLNKDITVAINFHNVNGDIKKSIILADKDESAVINHDFSVTHQGEHIEVEETDAVVKLVLEKHEVTVTCIKARDVCTVSLDNGYLFGRVAGLLGTYNNEQYDDLRTPAGDPTTNVEEFAASWKLDQQCTEAVVPEHPEFLPEAQSACSAAFSSRWSSLSSGFKYSDPSEFEYICNRLAIENGWTVEEATCTAAEAYKQTLEGVVSVNQLSECSQ